MQNSDGIIVILSYPDTIVRPAYWEFSSKIWPLIGIGGKHAVQAGHAAFLLIKKEETEINYFDFGRYITSYGNGRVRSKETDPELVIPVLANFKNGRLTNLKEILLWLDKHPEKTHGEGRLVATINNRIDYKKAKAFIISLINKKEIPYGAFIKKGTNCARFVTDTIITASTLKKIKSRLKKSNLFTPSPIGNVIKGTTTNLIFEVINQQTKTYQNRSIIKEYKTSFLKKFDIKPNLIGTELPNKNVFDLKKATWLGGIGSGAWFKIEEKINAKNYIIARYTSEGFKDFEGDFYVDKKGFKIQKPHQFLHSTNCNEAFIKQNKQVFCFKSRPLT